MRGRTVRGLGVCMLRLRSCSMCVRADQVCAVRVYVAFVCGLAHVLRADARGCAEFMLSLCLVCA